MKFKWIFIFSICLIRKREENARIKKNFSFEAFINPLINVSIANLFHHLQNLIKLSCPAKPKQSNLKKGNFTGERFL